MRPVVSVIVPIYNVEQYLKRCLDSLVNQTFKEIEILCVNDGSPDQSQKIVDEYVGCYPTKVKSLIKPNLFRQIIFKWRAISSNIKICIM